MPHIAVPGVPKDIFSSVARAGTFRKFKKRVVVHPQSSAEVLPINRVIPMVEPNSSPRTGTHKVIMFGYDDAQILDVTGPLEVFSRASRWLVDHGYAIQRPYDVELVGLERGDFACSSGVYVRAMRSFAEATDADTLLISGGIGYRTILHRHDVLDWIRQQADRVTRLGSICTGAFFLAEAGLLNHRTATTHWAYCDKLSQHGVDISVEADAIFIKQGNIYTSAGVTTGMDMSLAMVEEDWGAHVALAVAQELVLFTKRPGRHSQLSPLLINQAAASDRLHDVQFWLIENCAQDLSVEALAARYAMSPRNFTRRFTDTFGETPAKYVEKIRVNVATIRLEETEQSLEAIAIACGFSCADTMRRAFLRITGYTPSEFRKRREDAATADLCSKPSK